MRRQPELRIHRARPGGQGGGAGGRSGNMMDAAAAAEGRYDRLRRIAWWDQARLGRARILVVGVGALGNEILKNLALLGVGEIIAVDFDRIEASNLSRSILFRPSDVGRVKAEVAAERLRDLNPDVRTVPNDADVTSGIGIGVVRRVDVVLAGLDSVGARIAVNRLCRLAGRPWIDGGLHELSGLVRGFAPDRGACYECGLTTQDYANERRRHACQYLPR